jgi:S1-C subfamily serine protease
MRWATIFLFLFISSCSSYRINDSNIFFNGLFVKIEKMSVIVACNPSNHEQCFQHPAGSTGSAFLISEDDKKSYFLTAEHVCQANLDKYKKFFEVAEIKKIVGIDIDGKRHELKIEKVNKENDLCLLSTKKIVAKVYPISRTEPLLGDKIFNIAAPLGVYAKSLVPLFSGYYSGEAENRKLFTLPATNGSSGSPILNHRGEVIGMVSSVTINFNNMAISPTLKSIKLFVNSVDKQTN